MATPSKARFLYKGRFARRRPLFWNAVALCFGIALDQWLAPSSSLIWYGALVALVIGVVIVKTASGAPSERPYVHSGRAVLPFIACLFISIQIGLILHSTEFRIPTAIDVRNLLPDGPALAWVHGRIVEAERRTSASASPGTQRALWIVVLEKIGPDPQHLRPARGKVRLEIDPQHPLSRATFKPAVLENTGALFSLREGDDVEVYARLEPLPFSTLPDVFDFGAFLESQSIARIARGDLPSVRQIGAAGWWRIDLWLRRWSGDCAARLDETLAGHPREAGLLKAMLFGRRESLNAADREAFAGSGTAHLLAISGLHIHVLCFVFWRMLIWLRLPHRRAGVLIIAITVAYCLLTGSSPAAVRATTMVVCALGATLLWRDADPLSTLGAAAIAILAFAPHELFNAGFQLSFSAVLALSTLLPIVERILEKQDAILAVRNQLEETSQKPSRAMRALHWLRYALAVSVVAFLATAPVVAWHMGRCPCIGLVANLFAVPLLSIVMLAGAFLVVAGFISISIGSTAAWLVLPVVNFTQALLSGIASLPGAQVAVPPPPIALLLLFAAVLIALWIVEGSREEPRSGIMAGSFAALLLLLLATAWLHSRPSTLTITVLDVPTGRATLIESPNQTILIDAGGRGSGSRLAELLWHRHVSSLDAIIITVDETHAFDGAAELLAKVPPIRVLLPRCKFSSEGRRAFEDQLRAAHIPYDNAVSVSTLSTDAATLHFFDDGPDLHAPAVNATRVCVRIEAPKWQFLFADINSAASLSKIQTKLESAAALKTRVLRLLPPTFARQWPPETMALIQRTAAEWVIAGAQTPAEDLNGLDADALRARIVSPDEVGSVRISADNQSILHADVFRRTWRQLQDER